MTKTARIRSKKSDSSATQKEKQDLLRLERVFEMMEKHEVVELEWERPGERIRLKTCRAGAPHMVYAPAPVPASPALPVEAPKAAAVNSQQKQVLSPFVGTFYRSPSPTSDPYVREGQTVKRGDVLCIIEAMKLMNEIDAEFPGKIVSVLAENGQPVEFGEPLFVIEP